MRTRIGTILVAVVALVVGAAAGWLAAARACGDAAVSSKPPYQGDASPACNNGRARSMNAPNEKAKPRRKALIRSSADAEVQKRILENKISYLEKCIAAAKVSDAKPAEKKRETNAEIVERLMKLPTENERWTANAQSTVRPLTQDDAPLADQAATDIKDVKPSGPRKFKRVWTFADARDEDFVRKLAALNVQNVDARTPEKVALAKKYGMLPYIGAGAAAGTHGQVMTAAETNALHALNGEPPPSSLSKEEHAAWLKVHDEKRRQRLIACRYAFGGEPEPGREKDDVLQYGQPCFVGPVGRSNSVARVLASLDKNPEAEMVLFDYVGYQNYRRCHHPECESLYREYLAKNDLADTPENEKEFFLGELVAVNNAMHDAIKARNPKTVTGTHLYPVFLPEPLYGYRLKLDVIFETCAWYLKWPDEKIKAYATDCLTRKCADYPRARRIPFIAVTRGNWCEQKTAADVERELNDLLDAGVDEICAFEMTAIVDDPELYAVFLKYCGKEDEGSLIQVRQAKLGRTNTRILWGPHGNIRQDIQELRLWRRHLQLEPLVSPPAAEGG